MLYANVLINRIPVKNPPGLSLLKSFVTMYIYSDIEKAIEDRMTRHTLKKSFENLVLNYSYIIEFFNVTLDSTYFVGSNLGHTVNDLVDWCHENNMAIIDMDIEEKDE